MAARPIDLMIGGAQKAGTSSLKAYLGQHPHVCAHGSREFAWFVNDELHARPYEDVFPEFFSPRDAQQRIIAKSAGVLHLPEAADRLAQHNSNLRLVFLLRHPVDRAYSAFWYARRKGWEPLESFEAAIEAGPERFGDDWVRQRNCAYLARSEYAQAIQRFNTRFGEENVATYLLEDLKHDAAGLCREIFASLGVDASFQPDFSTKRNAAATAKSEHVARLLTSRSPLKRAVRKVLPTGLVAKLKKSAQQMNEREFVPPAMAPETRARLTAHFREHNDRLSELLGRDLSHWNAA